MNYHNANANASERADVRKRKKWKIFHFLALAFAFHTCEPGQRKGKLKGKMKNTRSMPLRFTFKPRWRPPPPSLISFPESLFPDCWSMVTQTIGTRLPPSWDTEMRLRISFSCVCVRRVNVACACPCVCAYICVIARTSLKILLSVRDNFIRTSVSIFCLSCKNNSDVDWPYSSIHGREGSWSFVRYVIRPKRFKYNKI